MSCIFVEFLKSVFAQVHRFEHWFSRFEGGRFSCLGLLSSIGRPCHRTVERRLPSESLGNCIDSWRYFKKFPWKKKLKIEFKLLLTSSSYGFFYFNSLNCLHCLHFVLQLFIVLKFFKYSWKTLFQVECTFIFIEFTSTGIVHSWLEVITLSNYARCGMNIDDATNVSCIEVSCVEMGIGC